MSSSATEQRVLRAGDRTNRNQAKREMVSPIPTANSCQAAQSGLHIAFLTHLLLSSTFDTTLAVANWSLIGVYAVGLTAAALLDLRVSPGRPLRTRRRSYRRSVSCQAPSGALLFAEGWAFHAHRRLLRPRLRLRLRRAARVAVHADRADDLLRETCGIRNFLRAFDLWTYPRQQAALAFKTINSQTAGSGNLVSLKATEDLSSTAACVALRGLSRRGARRRKPGFLRGPAEYARCRRRRRDELAPVHKPFVRRHDGHA